jgi:hypothetical protein
MLIYAEFGSVWVTLDFRARVGYREYQTQLEADPKQQGTGDGRQGTRDPENRTRGLTDDRKHHNMASYR